MKNEGFIERRKEANAAVIKLIEQVQTSVDELRDLVNGHISGLEDQRKAIIADLLREAFPEGDHEAHRRYHESLIRAAEDRAAFWKKMRDELAKWGLIGFTGWALWALIQAAVAAIHR